MPGQKKQYETICGCHVAGGKIVFCESHAKVGRFAALLDNVRTYFLASTGEESPYVKKIDALIPRRES
jgi:hypothetical protein